MLPSQKEQSEMLSMLKNAMEHQREYYEICAALIMRFPELPNIVRDGRACINTYRRRERELEMGI